MIVATPAQRQAEKTRKPYPTRQRGNPSSRINTRERDFSQYENVKPESLPKWHIEHPSNHSKLEQGIKEGLEDIKAGRVERATPEFFERVKREAMARAGL